MQTLTAAVYISCCISNTDPTIPLGLEVWLDGSMVFDQPSISDPIQFVHTVADDDADHEIRWVMKNKITEHTTIDQQGNIVKDACLVINDLKFDDIDLGHIFVEKSSYHHDFNGTAAPVEEKFYGNMGCNGSVSLKFTTPIYLWLLENL